MTAQELQQLQPGQQVHVIVTSINGFPKHKRVLFAEFTPSDSGYPEVIVMGKTNPIKVDKENVFADYLSAGIELDQQWEAALTRMRQMEQWAMKERERERETLKIVTGHTF